jgi:hypothetical protein
MQASLASNALLCQNFDRFVSTGGLSHLPVKRSERAFSCRCDDHAIAGISIIIGIGFSLFRRTYQHGGYPW